jgi:hypothetical protein
MKKGEMAYFHTGPLGLGDPVTVVKGDKVESPALPMTDKTEVKSKVIVSPGLALDQYAQKP